MSNVSTILIAGHGPFSHAFDGSFMKKNEKSTKVSQFCLEHHSVYFLYLKREDFFQIMHNVHYVWRRC